MNFHQYTHGQLINFADTASIHSDTNSPVGVIAFTDVGAIHAANTLPGGLANGINEGGHDVIHAEVAMVAHAAAVGFQLAGAHVAVTRFPCYECMAALCTALVGSIITRPMSEQPYRGTTIKRYRQREALALAIDCGVEVLEVPHVEYYAFKEQKELN